MITIKKNIPFWKQPNIGKQIYLSISYGLQLAAASLYNSLIIILLSTSKEHDNQTGYYIQIVQFLSRGLSAIFVCPYLFSRVSQKNTKYFLFIFSFGYIILLAATWNTFQCFQDSPWYLYCNREYRTSLLLISSFINGICFQATWILSNKYHGKNLNDFANSRIRAVFFVIQIIIGLITMIVNYFLQKHKINQAQIQLILVISLHCFGQVMYLFMKKHQIMAENRPFDEDETTINDLTVNILNEKQKSDRNSTSNSIRLTNNFTDEQKVLERLSQNQFQSRYSCRKSVDPSISVNDLEDSYEEEEEETIKTTKINKSLLILSSKNEKEENGLHKLKAIKINQSQYLLRLKEFKKFVTKDKNLILILPLILLQGLMQSWWSISCVQFVKKMADHTELFKVLKIQIYKESFSILFTSLWAKLYDTSSIKYKRIFFISFQIIIPIYLILSFFGNHYLELNTFYVVGFFFSMSQCGFIVTQGPMISKIYTGVILLLLIQKDIRSALYIISTIKFLTNIIEALGFFMGSYLNDNNSIIYICTIIPFWIWSIYNTLYQIKIQ